LRNCGENGSVHNASIGKEFNSDSKPMQCFDGHRIQRNEELELTERSSGLKVGNKCDAKYLHWVELHRKSASYRVAKRILIRCYEVSGDAPAGTRSDTFPKTVWRNFGVAE
jgi:hypothetical protein